MYELTNVTTGEKKLVNAHTSGTLEDGTDFASFADEALTGENYEEGVWENAEQVVFANPNKDGAFADGETLDTTGTYTIKLAEVTAE